MGCDPEDFRTYYGRSGRGDLKGIEGALIARDPSRLIVGLDRGRIVAHIIWHESNTEAHREGHPRADDDSRLLRRLMGGKKTFVELHELWLLEEYRGRGFGSMLVEFFEERMTAIGYMDVIFYANHPAAIAICRRRGWREGYLESESFHVFHTTLQASRQTGCS
jgi:GNAT superfamily N-acetyltransferase